MYRRPGGCFGKFNRSRQKKSSPFFFKTRTPFIISFFYGFLLSSLMSYFYAVCWQTRCHYTTIERKRNHLAYNVRTESLSLAVNGILGLSANCRTHLRCENIRIKNAIANPFQSTTGERFLISTSLSSLSHHIDDIVIATLFAATLHACTN